MKNIGSVSFVVMMAGLLLLGASAMAEDGGFAVDDAKNFLQTMMGSSFGDVEVAGDAVTYYNLDGTVRCRCEYEFAGKEAVTFGGEEFDWYKFELKSGDEACSEYKYLIATGAHSEGDDGMVHWHMRYGNSSFDDLINNLEYVMWYPTLAEGEISAEKLAENYGEGAPMLGAMMKAARAPSITLDAWNGTWSNPGMILDDSAMDPVYEAMAMAANSAEEPEKIQIYDAQGELISLSVEEAAEEAHGDLCLCAAVAARVTQVAISELFGDEIPTQGMLKVSYHHPGQGQRECFEYILTSECVDYVPSGDSKNLNLEDHFVYEFVRRDAGAVFETRVKVGVIPEEFFDLRYKVEGFSKGWHEDQPTEEEKAAFMQKKSEARKNILTMEAHQIFEGLDGNVAEGAVSTASA
ncbi:MAG: ZinT/AdcA family metal-binding protein [Methanothrix sp.]|nr:ZinT/AdcA family metal-binding protein [Methanothrix sp.]